MGQYARLVKTKGTGYPPSFARFRGRLAALEGGRVCLRGPAVVGEAYLSDAFLGQEETRNDAGREQSREACDPELA